MNNLIFIQGMFHGLFGCRACRYSWDRCERERERVVGCVSLHSILNTHTAPTGSTGGGPSTSPTGAGLRRSGREGGWWAPAVVQGVSTPSETDYSTRRGSGTTATEWTGGSGQRYVTESNQQVWNQTSWYGTEPVGMLCMRSGQVNYTFM